MFDIQDIYNRLLAARYQETLFSDLAGRRPQGQETTATCPFCEKAGKFSYNATRPVWKCWSCGEAGDWLQYLEKQRGLPFKEALLDLARQAGVEVPDRFEADQKAYTVMPRGCGSASTKVDFKGSISSVS